MEWISVDSRLPQNNTGLYLCSGHNGMNFLCNRRGNEWIRHPQMRRVIGITHWFKIPSLPGGDK